MNVTISVSGRFHAFNQAHQLHRHGNLDRLITTYPKYEAKKYGIPPPYIHSLLRYEIANRGWNKYLAASLSEQFDFNSWYCDAFDRAAAKHIPPSTEVYIGWASKSEQGLKRAKELGALAILDRGSSHAVYNKRILAEEYEAYGVKKWLPPDNIIQKELREYALADYILIPSNFVRRSFVEQGVPESKLITIPYGVDLRSFRPVEKEDNKFRVLYVGGMHLRKGVHYLLQAFHELNLPDAELWLIGSKSPEIEPFFEKYSRNVRYFGHIPQSKLNKYYSQCSVFCICSIEEGMAMVQAQAMACGLPLICTKNTGGEDLVEESETGFVVPVRNLCVLKERITWCFSNQETCRAMGKVALEKISSGFRWEDYGNSLSFQMREKLEKMR